MTKGRVALTSAAVIRDGESCTQSAKRTILPSTSQTVEEGTNLPLCHPDPDFLYVAPSMTACAAFSKESRMRFANANELHRKSGGAKPRDLRFFQPAADPLLAREP